jgi:hypothetical protein
MVIRIELNRTTNPMILTVQPKPRGPRHCRAINGKMIPPVAPPDAVQAIAKERFLEK